MPMAFLRSLILLSCTLSLNPRLVRKIILDLTSVTEGLMEQFPTAWRTHIYSLSSAVIWFYGHLVFECTLVFGRADIDQVVMSLL